MDDADERMCEICSTLPAKKDDKYCGACARLMEYDPDREIAFNE